MKILYFVLFCLLTISTMKAEYLIPSKIEGVKVSSISLNGCWSILDSSNIEKEVEVPGELLMQGVYLEHDKIITYLKKTNIPSDWKKKRVILRFDGVYSYAKLWINGNYVRDHLGGFTRWEADITSFLKFDSENEIRLEVVDRRDDISYASGYAHHPICGILRDVTIFAVNNSAITHSYTETLLDSSCQDAVLKIKGNLEGAPKIPVKFRLLDNEGKSIASSDIVLTADNNGNFVHDLNVEKPQKWDPEHPFLYTLEIVIGRRQSESSVYKQKVGFREIEVKENVMYVNDKPVKLRGACRHDMHPLLGRISTHYLDSLDAHLFKDANLNFVRTSHYPPSERFVDFCDSLGIFVECETPACFVTPSRPGAYAGEALQNMPQKTEDFLNQLKEMLFTFRKHPSIILWSIGNESSYGLNFQRSYDLLKKEDKTRPVIFSWPSSVDRNKKAYDILSMHYPDISGNQEQGEGIYVKKFQTERMPALFDEWAHVSCYAFETLQNDPNIRDFWGKSLDMLWGNIFESKGGLGGAIWGFVDETFNIPVFESKEAWWLTYGNKTKPSKYQNGSIGYGEWGIVDVWRRKKPEFWSVKKAYSPIRLLDAEKIDFVKGLPLMISVHNRFDHTDLNEIKAKYYYKESVEYLNLPSILPHEKGIFTIPAHSWSNGDTICVEFASADNRMIDIYNLVLKDERYVPVFKDLDITSKGGEDLKIETTDSHYIIKNNLFTLPVNKKNGWIENLTCNGKIVIKKGPFINLDINLRNVEWGDIGASVPDFVLDDCDWKLEGLKIDSLNNEVNVYIDGKNNGVDIKLKMSVYKCGKILFSYNLNGAPKGLLREAGIKLYLDEQSVEHIKWKRQGYWSFYPEGELSENEGEAPLYNENSNKYRETPQSPWVTDTHNYYYFSEKGCDVDRPLVQIVKGMKENIYYYTLKAEKDDVLSVVSPKARLACRLNNQVNKDLILYINNKWDYPEITWSDDCEDVGVYPCYGMMQINLY